MGSDFICIIELGKRNNRSRKEDKTPKFYASSPFIARMIFNQTGKLLFILIVMVTGTFSQGVDIGRFWFLSDLHHDFTYGVQEEAESCRRVIPSTQLGMFGNYDCDIPWITINQTIYTMKKLAPDVDFILWTGDSVMHTRRYESLTLNVSVNIGLIKDITKLIKEAFPKARLIPTIGNHDFFPNAQTSTAMYADFETIWSEEIQPHNDTFKAGGYYISDVSPQVRLLNLNTILYYKRNKNVNPKTIPDPAKQFDWLEKQLLNSQNENKKVFISGHIPPGLKIDGDSWFHSLYNERFIQLVQQYADVISAMFFGHDHQTSYKIIPGIGMGSIPVFIISSVTPWTYDYNHNPAVWLVSYDRQSMTPSKIDQYYVDLLQANRLKSLDYRLEYSIPSEYKMGNISAESLLDLRTRMESNDSLFGKYMRHMFADVTTKKKPEITLDLKIKVLCAMNSMDKKSFGACKAHGIKPVNNTLKVSINTILLLNIFILTILTLGYSTFL